MTFEWCFTRFSGFRVTPKFMKFLFIFYFYFYFTISGLWKGKGKDKKMPFLYSFNYVQLCFYTLDGDLINSALLV